MMRILDFDSLSPEAFLNRDIQAEEDVSAAVDETGPVGGPPPGRRGPAGLHPPL